MFCSDVARLIEEQRIELLLPMTDLSASILLALREMDPDLVIPFPARDAYEAISDKQRLAETAASVGVPVPRYIVLDSRSDDADRATAFADQAGWPIVLKPARSVVRRDDAAFKLWVAIVNSRAAVEQTLAAYPDAAYPILVQEHIDGPGLGAFMLSHDGRTIAAFGHRRLREKPPTGGVSVYRESVVLRDDVRMHAERLLDCFGWTGVAMVEFKEDRTTGIPYLMEVNGRFWGSLQLAIDAGVDFPALLVRMALGEEVAPIGDYRVGVRSRWLWGDVDHLVWLLRTPRVARAAHSELPGRIGAIGRFLIPWRPGDRLEVLRVGDPGPFFRESIEWIRNLVPRAHPARR